MRIFLFFRGSEGISSEPVRFTSTRHGAVAGWGPLWRGPGGISKEPLNHPKLGGSARVAGCWDGSFQVQLEA